jgi:hypothetical protein
MTEIACGSKEFAPLSRFPQGQAGAGRFPPRREARCAPRKSAWHASMPPAPPASALARGLDRSGTTACLRKQIGPKIGPDAGESITPKLETALVAKKEKPPRRLDLTVPSHGSHAWVARQVQTKFLRLFSEVTISDHIDGWRVCWIGGWDKCRVLFVVMVERPKPSRPKRSARRASQAQDRSRRTATTLEAFCRARPFY